MQELDAMELWRRLPKRHVLTAFIGALLLGSGLFGVYVAPREGPFAWATHYAVGLIVAGIVLDLPLNIACARIALEFRRERRERNGD